MFKESDNSRTGRAEGFNTPAVSLEIITENNSGFIPIALSLSLIKE